MSQILNLSLSILIVFFFMFIYRVMIGLAYNQGIIRGVYICLRRQGRTHESALEYIEEALKTGLKIEENKGSK